jgi:heptosyltransferase-2
MKKKPHKLLVVLPNWLGDIIISQTLLKLIKQQTPNTPIDVLAPHWALPLLKYMPEVERVHTTTIAHGKLALQKRYQIARGLRKENYGQAIILPNSIKSALIPYWAKIPIRTGWRGEYRYGLINDMRAPKLKSYSIAEQYGGLTPWRAQPRPLNQLPQPCLKTDPNKAQQISAELALQPLSKPVLALCPGAAYGPSKRWPVEHFAAIAKQKLAENWQVWLLGSKKERALAEHINRLTENGCVNLAGETQLDEVIHLLAYAQVAVSNDSGLMHMAAALRRPVIAIYGSTRPDFAPPLHNQAQTLSLNLSCSPCGKRTCPYQHYHCLTQLKPKPVLDAIAQLTG